MSYGFRTTSGWVINDIIFIFGWTNPLTKECFCFWLHVHDCQEWVHSCFVRSSLNMNSESPVKAKGVLCDSNETLNTALFLHPYQKFISAFHPIYARDNQWVEYDHVCFDFEQSRQISSCFFSLSKHDLKHTCTQSSTCMNKSHHPNAQGQSKDFFITCKHCDTDTNQGVHIITKTRWKSLLCPFIKAHGETVQIRQRWAASVCNPAQGHTATSSHT